MIRSALVCLALLGVIAPEWARASLLSDWMGDPRITIDGAGFLSDLRLERSLNLLAPEDVDKPTLDLVFIEDSVWLLVGDMRNKGYRRPTIHVDIVWQNGEQLKVSWNSQGGFDQALPEDRAAASLAFRIDRGQLYYFVEDGITAELPPDFALSRKPQNYFYASDALLIGENDRFFTDGRLNRGVRQIEEEFRDQGYRDAAATVTERKIDHANGEVTVHLQIQPGKRYYVRRADIEINLPDTTEQKSKVFDQQRFTQSWLNGFIFSFRDEYYRQGYPETETYYEIIEVEETADTVFLELRARIETGPKIRLREIHFDGEGQTDKERLRNVLEIQEGDLLDPNAVQRGRGDLRALNIFAEVEAKYEDNGDGTWDLLYDTKLRENFAVSLIFGAGTFDILRLGFEVRQNNLWHLAHQQRLRVIQSLKTTSATYTYSIPKLLGDELSLFGNADFLRREQINFIRQEYGGGVGVQRFWPSTSINASIEHRVELLTAEDLRTDDQPGAESALVTNLLLRASQSSINNPVFPSRGHAINASYEYAYPAFSEIEYNQIEFGGSYHIEAIRGTIFHFGYSQGLLFNYTGRENVPVNQRFLLGGENTVRGYKRDEASPRNKDGDIIGGESYSLIQVQLEQRLTKNISLNVFLDTLAIAAEIQDTFDGEILSSLGGGVSFRTPVGPLRFEYAYNLERRARDPAGAFHFSLGFPF